MRSETKLVLSGGVFAGLIGYATVVILFAVINVAGGRSPFHTPAMFGSALFYGLEDPGAVDVAAGPVLAYNMIHVVAFLLLGFLGSSLASLAERIPSARFAVLFVLLFVAGHLYAALLIFAQPLLTGAVWLQVGFVSLAAAVAMGWYLLALHPALKGDLMTNPIGDEE
jgi:hypothetical protein